MKVFTRTHVPTDRGMCRVMAALERHAPDSIEIVPDMDAADLVIVHVIGRLDGTTQLIEKLKEEDKHYAIVQYAIRSTKTPNTKDWLPLWQDAALVWSYYDLPMLCREDGTDPAFNFYHSPLGTYFHRDGPERRKYVIATSGLSYLTESVRECVLAAKEFSHDVFHVGPELNIPNVDCSNGMSDEELAAKYSQCLYVSGLRRIEGFEFPVIEGLMCGARPICFDKPHYRAWFEDFAIFVPEGPREQVIESLKREFRIAPIPVLPKEKAMAKERFNWDTIIAGFYSRL